MRHLVGKTWEPWMGETGVFVSLRWEPRDMWLGLYATWEDCDYPAFTAYVCLVPCLPIVVTFVKSR